MAPEAAGRGVPISSRARCETPADGWRRSFPESIPATFD